MVWAAIGTAVVGGAISYLTAPDQPSGGSGGGAAGMADPFAAQRPQYQEQLNTLMNGTFSPTDPSYQWRFDQGMEGVNRTLASQGMTNSGNQLAELTNYGQGLASTEYSNQYQRLAQLSGATSGSPAAAGQIQAGQDQSALQGSTAFGGLIGDAAGALIDGWNSGGGADPADMTGFNTGASSYDNYDWVEGNSATQPYFPSSNYNFDWMY